MVANINLLEDDRAFEEEWHDNLCGLVLEALDELDSHYEAFAEAMQEGSEGMARFLLANPKWARVVRYLVRIKLHEFDRYDD